MMMMVDTIGGNAIVDAVFVVVACVVAVVVVAWSSGIHPLRSTWCVPVWCVLVIVNSTGLSGTPVEVCLCVIEE